VLSVSSALSLSKVFLLTLPKKKYPKKYQRFCPQGRQLAPFEKGTKREKKKRRRFVPLCPAARESCSFLTAREGQKHFRAYQTGARKRRERESGFFVCVVQIRAFLFFRCWCSARAPKFTNDYKALFFVFLRGI